MLFFARLYGVQGRLEWPADLKATLDLRAPTDPPELEVLGLREALCAQPV